MGRYPEQLTCLVKVPAATATMDKFVTISESTDAGLLELSLLPRLNGNVASLLRRRSALLGRLDHLLSEGGLQGIAHTKTTQEEVLAERLYLR